MTVDGRRPRQDRVGTGSRTSPTTSVRPTCGTPSPRAPSRRSPSWSSVLGLEPGMTVLDVGCGPGRHALALASAASRCSGSTSASASSRSATRSPTARGVSDLVEFHALDARAMAADARFDGPGLRRRHLAVPGGVRAGRAARRRRPAEPGTRCGPSSTASAARCARVGALAVSAFSSYFQVRWLEDQDSFDAAAAVNHEPTELRDTEGASGRRRPVDHLLHAPRAAPARRALRRSRSTTCGR